MFGESSAYVKMFYLMVVLTSIILLYFLYNMTYWKRRGVHYLKPNLLLGNTTDLLWSQKPSGTFLRELYEKGEGHSFFGTWIFQTPTLIIREPNLIKDVLVKEFTTFCDRASGGDGESDVLGRKNLFFGNNPEWKFLRTKFSPNFTGNKLKNMYVLMRDVSSNLRNYLNEEIGTDGKIVELKSLYDRYSIDVIVSCAFGVKSNAIYDENCTFRKLNENVSDSSTQRLFTVYVMMPKLIDIFRLRLLGSYTELVRSVFTQTINQREKSKEKRGDIIDGILEIQKTTKDGPMKFEGDALVSQALTFFNAGTETTASTISFAIYYLAMHPEVQEKARAEALAIKKKYGEFNYESLSELKYIKNVIQETLRLHAPFPVLNRICRKNYQIPNSDVIIEKGIPVYIPMLGLHMDPKHFPDPEKFDPDRFSEERKSEIKPFTYMPFGEGPRICIGMRLAMLSAKLALAQFLVSFKGQPCALSKFPVKLLPGSVALRSEEGLHVKLTPLKA